MNAGPFFLHFRVIWPICCRLKSPLKTCPQNYKNFSVFTYLSSKDLMKCHGPPVSLQTARTIKTIKMSKKEKNYHRHEILLNIPHFPLLINWVSVVTDWVLTAPASRKCDYSSIIRKRTLIILFITQITHEIEFHKHIKILILTAMTS